MPPAVGTVKCNWTEHTSPNGIHLLMDTSTTTTEQLVKANGRNQRSFVWLHICVLDEEHEAGFFIRMRTTRLVKFESPF
ncbi:hypothetical protein Hanom_Chr09g00834801 [Helianthus anomalus]